MCSSSGKSPPRRSRTIQATNLLVMIDEKRSTLNRSAYLFSSRKFANSQDLHTACGRAQHAGDQSSALQWGNHFATAYQQADGREVRAKITAVHSCGAALAWHGGRQSFASWIVNYAQGAGFRRENCEID